MFKLNGKIFVNLGANISRDGFFTVHKNEIKLYDNDKNFVGVITRRLVCCATSTYAGRRFYHPWPPALVGSVKSLSEYHAELEKILRMFGIEILYC